MLTEVKPEGLPSPAGEKLMMHVRTLRFSLVFLCAAAFFAAPEPRRAEAQNPKASPKTPTTKNAGGKARLRVALVIDASGSMQTQDRYFLSRVAAKLFVDLAGAEDEVGIVEFGTNARLIGRTFVTSQEQRNKLYGFIDQVGRSQECTDYRAGLEQAMAMFPGKPSQGERRLIIFLTDGTYDPDRSNASYYTLLSDQEKEKVWGTRIQKFFEKVQKDEKFKSLACANRYNMLKPAARAGFRKAFGKFIKEQLVPADVKVFAIGFGTALGVAAENAAARRIPPDVTESLGLLRKLAKSTRGKALIESDVSRIPGFFAEIFAALVGAPVEALPPHGKPMSSTYDFKVIKGTRAMAVVVPTLGDKSFSVKIERLEAKKGSDAKVERVREYNEQDAKGRVLAGYRFFWLADPKPGTYRVMHVKGASKSFRAQILLDVGLKLVWLPPLLQETYPETIEGELKAKFGLRTASGDKVAGLSEKFMSDMRFYWQVRREGTLMPLATGTPVFDPANPMKPMELSVPRSKVTRGKYTVEIWAAHEKGFFELRRASHNFKVVKFIEMDADLANSSFDIKARQGFKKKGWVTLHLKNDLESPQKFVLDLSGIASRDQINLRLTNDTKECRIKRKLIKAHMVEICLHKKEQGVRIDLTLRKWTTARKKERSFKGVVRLIPVKPQLFKGKKSWQTETAGVVRPWSLADWIRFYKWYLIAAIALFVILLWLFGRAVAGKFPPKAMLYYKDMEDKASEPSSYRIGQKATSFLPFVSASHDIGGSGVPRSGKVLCTLRAKAGGTFMIKPGAVAVSFEMDGEKQSQKNPFDGRFDQHYTVGEQYEIWLTRTPEE